MHQALLLGDANAKIAHSMPAMAEFMMEVFDGLFDIDARSGLEQLTPDMLGAYDLIINYSDALKKSHDKHKAANLISYVADGGNYLAIHHGIDNGELFELNCLTAAKMLPCGFPLLLDFFKSDVTHPITERFQPMQTVEEPLHCFLDPFLPSEVLIEAKYASIKLPVMWCHGYGWGKVACLTVGHTRDSLYPYFVKPIYHAGQWFLNRI